MEFHLTERKNDQRSQTLPGGRDERAHGECGDPKALGDFDKGSSSGI